MVTIVLNETQAEALSALLYSGVATSVLNSLDLNELQKRLNEEFRFRLANVETTLRTVSNDPAEVKPATRWDTYGLVIDVS